MSKFIRFSVGRSARNASSDDVITIQYLLNCVPVSLGGPMKELATTGIADAETIAAISRFQVFGMELATGRVDVDGETLARLQLFDPYPGVESRHAASIKVEIGAAGIKPPTRLAILASARGLMGPPKIGEATAFSAARGAGLGGSSNFYEGWPAKLTSDGPIKFPRGPR